MRSKYCNRELNDERLLIALPAAQKRLLFEVAAKEGVSVAHILRRAILQAAAQHLGQAA